MHFSEMMMPLTSARKVTAAVAAAPQQTANAPAANSGLIQLLHTINRQNSAVNVLCLIFCLLSPVWNRYILKYIQEFFYYVRFSPD